MGATSYPARSRGRRKRNKRRSAHGRSPQKKSTTIFPYRGPVIDVPDLGEDPLDEHGAPVGKE
jgi:hypothetical protein